MELKVPNWCSVSFDVRGPAEDLVRFQEFVAGNDQGHERVVDFNKVFPMPEELQATGRDFGFAYDVYHGDGNRGLECR